MPRTVAAWADAWPGLIQAPTTTADPYRSNVNSSSLAIPAYAQDPNDPTSWLPDTGIIAQKVAVAGGAELPAGTPVIVVPFSISTEQQMAAIPASTQLVAVWYGGKAEGPLGTLVYDVKPDGSLDPQRRARDHSSWRVYRLPPQGLIPFGADPGAASKPFPVSSGLAWQQGLDVDGQAGYGMIVDQVAGAPPPPPPTVNRTATGGAPPASPDAATGTTSKPNTPPPATQTQRSVFGVTSKRGFGGHSVGVVGDKHLVATTPDLEPVNSAHWNVLQPIDGDGFDAPMATAGIWIPPTGGGPLWSEVFFRYDDNSQHPFLDGTRKGLRRWETRVPFDVPPPAQDKPGQDKTGDKNPGADKASDKNPGTDKGFGDDKDINPSSDNGEHRTKPPEFDGGKPGDFTKPPQNDKSLNDKAISDNQTKFGDAGNKVGDAGVPPGTKLGDTGAFSKALADFNNPTAPTPPNKLGDTGAFSKALADFNNPDAPPPSDGPSTFGGTLLLGGTASKAPFSDLGLAPPDGGTIMIDRRYVRTPLEFAGPGWIGRPVLCNGPDTRGAVDGLTVEQQAAYQAATPISGVISAVGDQTGGSPVWFPGSGPGAGVYVGGAANAGGFALHPANRDVKDIQAGKPAPPSMPPTTLFITPGASIGFGGITPGGLTAGGVVLESGGTGKLNARVTNADGTTASTTTLVPAAASNCCTGDEFGDGSDGNVSFSSGTHFTSSDKFYT